MLTRKDFKAIAAIIKLRNRAIYHNCKDIEIMLTDSFVADMADYLATTNPAFDRERFIAACK